MKSFIKFSLAMLLSIVAASLLSAMAPAQVSPLARFGLLATVSLLIVPATIFICNIVARELAEKKNSKVKNAEPCTEQDVDDFVKIIRLGQMEGFVIECEPLYKNMQSRFGTFIASDKGEEFCRRIRNKILLEKATGAPQNFYELLD